MKEDKRVTVKRIIKLNIFKKHFTFKVPIPIVFVKWKYNCEWTIK